MGQQFLKGIPVGDDHSLKAHFPAQHLPQQPLICGRGNPVQGIEGGHDQFTAGPDGRLIRRQVILPKGALGKLDGIVIPSSVRCAVSGKMLEAGGYLSRFPEIMTLIAPDHGGGHLTAQERILAGGFHDPSPAGIPDQICHGREGDVEA